MIPTLIVSLDFELFWGMQDCNTLQEYGPNILGGRAAIPRILELFTRYGIHATWATVGFVFGRGKESLQGYLPLESLRPTYQNPVLSTYPCLDRLDQSGEDADYFFAPELVKRIAATEGQQIGTHTFSHYYCREAGQTTRQFSADMQAAQCLAQDFGTPVSTVVLPRNQCTPDHIRVLKELGFLAYRDEENDWIHEKIHFRPLLRLLRLADVYLPLTGQGGYIPQNEDGIVNLAGSRMYKPYFRPLACLEGLKIKRIKAQMLHAARKGLTFHLWWHPHNVGVLTDFHLRQLEELFAYYQQLHQTYGMRSLNMEEAAQEVLAQS